MKKILKTDIERYGSIAERWPHTVTIDGNDKQIKYFLVHGMYEAGCTDLLIDTSENEFGEPLFYITSPHGASGIGIVGNSVLWWGKERCGYTTNLDEAGRYSRAEAESIVNNKRGDKMFPCAPVDQMARSEVHIDSLRKYELEYACAVGTGYMKDFLDEHQIDQVRPADTKGEANE